MAILLLVQKRSFTDAWRLEMCPAAVRPCVLPGAGVPERGASCSRAGSQRSSCCRGKAGARRSAELYVRCLLAPAAIRVTLELKVFELDESMAGGVVSKEASVQEASGRFEQGTQPFLMQAT